MNLNVLSLDLSSSSLIIYIYTIEELKIKKILILMDWKINFYNLWRNLILYRFPKHYISKS